MNVGFIGFGEAGSTIAGGLSASGVGRLVAFDIAADDPRLGPTIRARAERTKTTIVDSRAELAQASDLIFSTVTSSSALDAATENAPHLGPRHVYADRQSRRRRRVA